MSLTRKLGSVWIAALALLFSQQAVASNAGKHDAESLAKEADERPGASGAAAAADRQGKLRAITPEEARALVDAIAPYVSQSGEGLTAVRQPNGVMAIDLQDRFQSVSLARTGTDGHVEVRCVGTKEEASQFLAADGKSRSTKTREAALKKASTPKPASRTTAMTSTPAPLEEK